MSNESQKVIDDFKQELELSTDLYAIVHLLSSPPPDSDESEEDWERAELESSCLTGFENKYGRNLLRDMENDIQQMIDNYAERLVEGDYEDA